MRNAEFVEDAGLPSKVPHASGASLSRDGIGLSSQCFHLESIEHCTTELESVFCQRVKPIHRELFRRAFGRAGSFRPS